MKFSADFLLLPEGVKHAHRIDGMREIAMYVLAKDMDGFCARWCTVIDGTQYSVLKWMPQDIGHNFYEWVATQRDDSKKKLIELSQTKIILRTECRPFTAPSELNKGGAKAL